MHVCAERGAFSAESFLHPTQWLPLVAAVALLVAQPGALVGILAHDSDTTAPDPDDK